MRLITGNPLKDLTAIILAGGFGTRLRSVVSDRPKVLAEVRGRPFLGWILEYLHSYGIRDAIMCTGYLAEQVEQAFGSAFEKMRLRYSVERTAFGTGGAVANALRMETSESVLVLNGDSLVEADLISVWQSYCACGRPSIVATEVEATERFGRIELDTSGRVISFAEKDKCHGPGLINAGIYVLPRRLMEHSRSDPACSMERELFSAWMADGLYGFKTDGEFVDIGTPESFEAANDADREWEMFNRCYMP